MYAARNPPNPNDPADPVYRSDNFGAPGSWTPVSGTDHSLPKRGFARVTLAISKTAPPVLMAAMEDHRNGEDLKGIWISSNGGQNWTQINGHPPEFGEHSFVAIPDIEEVEPNDTLGSAQPISLGNVVDGELSSIGDGDVFRFHSDGNELSFEILADRAGASFDPQLRLFDADGNEWPGSPYNSEPGEGVQGSDDERLSPAWSTFPPGDYSLRVESAGGDPSISGHYQLSVIGSSLWCQCSYDQVIAIHPTDPSTMYWGGIRLFRTTDGGRNWLQIQDHEQPGQGPNWIHQDIHTVAMAPNEPAFMLWGTDGGIWGTIDGGDKWIDLNTNLGLTQFYQGISQHPTDAGFILGGSQDNAISRLRDGRWEWPASLSGDGGFTAIDPTDPTEKTWFAATQNLSLYRTTDDGVTASTIISGLGRSQVPLIAPFVIDPANPRVLLAGWGVLTSGSNPHWEFYIHRSTDAGQSWSPSETDLEAKIAAIAYAPSNSNICYAGTVYGRVWKSADSGLHWTEITHPPLPIRSLTDIAVDPTDSSTVCVIYGGTGGGHVFLTMDGGSSWTDISSRPYSENDLPDAPFFAVVFDPVYTETLFVGGDVGIYRTTDRGLHWTTFDEGLPNSPVFDLSINSTTDSLLAATHGRSMWKLTQGNDACINSRSVADGTVTGSTADMTNDGSATCGSSDSSPDAWFSYKAPITGVLQVNTCGSSLDTVLSIHEPGCPATSATQLTDACNDDCLEPLPGCGPRDSCLEVPVSLAQSYLIRVSGYAGETGPFVLSLRTLRPEPSNDACGPFFIPPSGTVHGWTERATNDGSSSCGLSESAPDVWYRFRADAGGRLEANTCTADFDTVLSIHSDCPGTVENEIACNDDCDGSPCNGNGSCIRIEVPAETEYMIRVSGFNGGTGDFELSVREMPLNDACTDAPLLAEGSTRFSTRWATTDGPDGDPLCNVSGSADLTNDLWYLYEAQCTGFTTIDTCDADFDTRIAVYEGRQCPTEPNSIVCNDDACGQPDGLQSRVSFPSEQGRYFLVRVGGYEGAVGTGTIVLDPGCGMIFADGFESGDTAAWDAIGTREGSLIHHVRGLYLNLR